MVYCWGWGDSLVELPESPTGNSRNSAFLICHPCWVKHFINSCLCHPCSHNWLFTHSLVTNPCTSTSSRYWVSSLVALMVDTGYYISLYRSLLFSREKQDLTLKNHGGHCLSSFLLISRYWKRFHSFSTNKKNLPSLQALIKYNSN